MKKKPLELRCGDLVDLQNDKYADPKGDNTLLECEFLTVDYIKHERTMPDCVAVGFSGFDVVGFPHDHLLDVQPCHTIETAKPFPAGDVERDLSLSLACYVSEEDWGATRRDFLQWVRDRIDMDLKGGTT